MVGIGLGFIPSSFIHMGTLGQHLSSTNETGRQPVRQFGGDTSMERGRKLPDRSRRPCAPFAWTLYRYDAADSPDTPGCQVFTGPLNEQEKPAGGQ